MITEETVKQIALDSVDFDAFMRKLQNTTLSHKEITKDNLNEVVFVETEWLTPVKIVKINKKSFKVETYFKKREIKFDINLKISDDLTYLIDKTPEYMKQLFNEVHI